MPLTYEAVDVPPAALADTMRALAAVRGAGNVTIPHKEAAARLVADRTPAAERAGAVNTFWVTDAGALVGDNTDVGGFDAAARELLGGAPADLRVALVGAGGAAAAVLAAVEQWPGSSVAIWNRAPERARALAARFPSVAHAEEFLAGAIRGADLVVNATPIGLHADDVPMNPALLRRRAAVLDLVYRRDGETPWVRLAQARGMRAAGGLTMLVEQGALAFERWFGRTADRAAMWEAL